MMFPYPDPTVPILCVTDSPGVGTVLTALWLCIRAQVVDKWIQSASYELLERRMWEAIQEAPGAAGQTGALP